MKYSQHLLLKQDKADYLRKLQRIILLMQVKADCLNLALIFKICAVH